jgi:hypothetical protein
MRPLLALFIRTFREHSRARSTYIVRGLIALVLLLMLWMSHSMQKWLGAPGRQFFGYIVAINYVFSTLAGLGICSGAIAEEKEEGTLGLLRMADLNPLSILLGKGTGRLGILLLFIVVQIPFSFLAVTLGGVSVRQVLMAYTLLGSYLFALANIALLFSVILPRVWRATLATTCVVGAFFFSPLLLNGTAEWLKERHDASRFTSLIQDLEAMVVWTASVDPPVHMFKLAQTSYYSLAVGRSVLTHVALGLACFALAWALFERFAKYDPAESSGPRRFSLRRLRLMRKPRPGAHSVAWKDFHFQLGGRASFVGRLIIYPCSVACLVWLDWYHTSRVTRSDIAEYGWGVGWVVFSIEVVLFTLRMWAPERWQLNLSSLLLTPLSLRRIQLEKLKAFLLAALPSLILLAASLVLSGGRFLRHVSFFEDFLTMVIAIVFFLVLCLNLSLRLRWAALPAAIAISFLLYMFVGMGMMVLFATTSFLSGGKLFGLDLSDIAPFVFFTGLAAATFFLWRNTHRQLQRLAAEA